MPWPDDAPEWLVREVGEGYIDWPFQEKRFAPYTLEPIGDPEDTNVLVGIMARPKKGRGVLESVPRLGPTEPIRELLHRLFDKLEPRPPLKRPPD